VIQQGGLEPTETSAETRRIDEEERRISETIAEAERLQAPGMEKEEVQKLKPEVMAEALGNWGHRSSAAGRVNSLN
jgi:hypothetical protein